LTPGPIAVEKVEKEFSKYEVDTYPADPRPATVDTRFGSTPKPKTVEVIVEASSTGSIKLLTYCSRPKVVDTKDKEET
jgi:hypothetical protein